MYLNKKLPAMLLGIGLTVIASANAQVGNNLNLEDPNLVESDLLQSLHHVSIEVANAIENARPITSASQLNQVLTELLDESQRTQLYTRLFRQINLNTASDEELLLIPGLDNRMAHEFEEYRPYTSLDQFRREIGKYVDAEEVARLEQYVFIPLNLNEASSQDLSSIPGMTARMVHEFEEYRPYTSLEQFRREIGKYVDADEVARLESYIILE